MRRLHDQLGLLQIADSELNAKAGAHYDDREQAGRELERLQQLIAESREGIEELRKETGSKNRSVAILPGTNARGTRRPPIYVECRGTGVYLQPEGIRFTREDFLGPPGPSSPLAAALRAAREHLVSQNSADAGDEAEPYALIAVRPDGVLYFQMVCEVIHQAGMDFGYELIDANWRLQYPTPSPRLAAVEGQAVAIARDHLQMMVSAAPRMLLSRMTPFSSDGMTPATLLTGDSRKSGGTRRTTCCDASPPRVSIKMNSSRKASAFSQPSGLSGLTSGAMSG